MEPNSLQWVGSPCGLHGPYIFYKAFQFHLEGKPRILSLGDFFFVRCTPKDPICIAELQLLWEERTSRQLLSSSKLYFLPEDTPQGRNSDHGEGCVLAHWPCGSGVLRAQTALPGRVERSRASPARFWAAAGALFCGLPSSADRPQRRGTYRGNYFGEAVPTARPPGKALCCPSESTVIKLRLLRAASSVCARLSSFRGRCKDLFGTIVRLTGDCYIY
ncbi:hypothetical protein FD755_004507 [Muntiacus reevesi]|uniref:BAH domain-containing protein n=2 Tax=Muntiacus TaxID=9885 RepID=A0A5J5MQM0_MUNRE|nr:hypothetical protein FD754_012249 [Muntiacus muntjak]KAB0382590.1 hypothetical protein FD755_004507 [Muntiacus reevesi]